MVGRFIVSVALAGAFLSGCSYELGDDAAAPSATPESEAAAPAFDLAGELGPNGGVMSGVTELVSTPQSLYPSQTDGGTAVGPVAALPGGLSVVREGERLCIELHGLPIGGALLARSCEIPAYASHDDVEDLGRAYVSDVVVDGETMRVVWGMTYLDAASVDFGDGSASASPETHFPFWMHRFFALPAPPDAQSLRILDDAGQELAVFPLSAPA